jgi:hypothetical protein
MKLDGKWSSDTPASDGLWRSVVDVMAVIVVIMENDLMDGMVRMAFVLVFKEKVRDRGLLNVVNVIGECRHRKRVGTIGIVVARDAHGLCCFKKN